MIIPIYGYGEPVLRQVGEEITPDYPNLKEIIDNMYETMYNAYGVGLAAHQIGLSIRLVVIDTEPFSESNNLTSDEKIQIKNFKRTFINPKILLEDGDEWCFNEGCLSIPDVRGDIYRNERITIEYCDEDFIKKTAVFDGVIARVIQHEYDHLEGILFTDKIAPLKRVLIKKKLQNIMEGKSFPDYRMRFANKKGR